MTGLLDDTIALITGTADGQGRAAALLFAAEGAKVASRVRLRQRRQPGRRRRLGCLQRPGGPDRHTASILDETLKNPSRTPA